MQLLQLVSLEQFKVTQSYVKRNFVHPVELFPLHDVLEHRYCRLDSWGLEVARIGQKGLVFQIYCNFVTLLRVSLCSYRVCLYFKVSPE
jgi:hypothetical protein